MKCVICKTGETFSGQTNVTLQRTHSLVVIKNVKAEICDNCGEYYLDEATAIEINAKAEREMASREV
ncbi:MAG: type II toxin-antitoxin system MqsA family antitoxin, partial [Cytophagales bacterium]